MSLVSRSGASKAWRRRVRRIVVWKTGEQSRSAVVIRSRSGASKAWRRRSWRIVVGSKARVGSRNASIGIIRSGTSKAWNRINIVVELLIHSSVSWNRHSWNRHRSRHRSRHRRGIEALRSGTRRLGNSAIWERTHRIEGKRSNVLLVLDFL